MTLRALLVLVGLVAVATPAAALEWDWTFDQAPENPGPTVLPHSCAFLPPEGNGTRSHGGSGYSVVCIEILGEKIVYIRACVHAENPIR